MFDNRTAADEHAIPQFGDAFLSSPSDIASVFRPQELPGIAYRLGDDRLRSDIDHAVSGSKARVTPDLLGRLWELMCKKASYPPRKPEEVLRVVAADRQATRGSTVPHRKEYTMVDKTTTTTATEDKPVRPIGRANFAPTSKISFGKDKDGEPYGKDNNPKRAGSGAHTRFALYKDGQTIAEAKEAGVTAGDINWDAKQGFIKIT